MLARGSNQSEFLTGEPQVFGEERGPQIGRRKLLESLLVPA